MSRLLLALICFVGCRDAAFGQSYQTFPHSHFDQRPGSRPSYQSTRSRTTNLAPTTTRSNYRPTVSSSLAAANSPARSRSRKQPYRLDAGDSLAVIVDGVLKFKGAPIHMPTKTNGILPGMGYPVPVLEDGTIALPLVELISVRGLTASEAQAKVANTYYDNNIIKRGKVVTVSLLRKRTRSITVVHSKPNSTVRDISIVKLTPDHSTVIGAITGVGVFDTHAEIQVIRGRSGRRVSSTSRLNDGDIVDVNSPQTGYFYTGGLLPGGQFEIPRDRDLTVLQAISIAGGSVGGGRLASFPPSDLVVIRAGRPALTVDLKAALRNGSLRIAPGDTLMLRYKPGEIAGNLAASALVGGAGLLLP